MTITPAVGVAAQRVVHRSGVLSVAALAVAVLWLSVGWSAAAAAPNSLKLRATYDVTAHIDWAGAVMDVSTTATVTNTTNRNIGRVTFNLVTLRTGAAQIQSVTAGGEPVTPVVTGQTLVVPIPGKLAPGNDINITIDYRASFNSISGNKRSLFVKKNGIVTAYRWIPWLSREQRFATPNFGETWVTGVSQRVSVRLSSSAALKYATTGRPTGKINGANTFEANDVRDFNFSASPNYKVRRYTWNGVAIRVFNRNLSRDALIKHTRRALNRFSDRIGRFPYGRLTIAEVPSGTGMESPALNWISQNMTGSRLRHILVHEVAHQYFYSAVGNNQATNPFVDEALADFLTRDHLGTFRGSNCATDRLDRAVYAYSARCYPEVIYTQGANYLRDYRNEVGGASFWAGLSRFYAERATDIVGTRALLDALDAESGFDSQRHAQRFPQLY